MIPSALESYSKALNGVSFAWTCIDIARAGEIKASDGLNTLAFVAGFIPAAGPVITASYATLDLFVIAFSGQSIGDYVDEIIEERYHYSGIPLSIYR